MKKVLFVASESVPFIKTGGLADVVGSLPKSFPKEEFDVRIVIPNYTCIPWQYRRQFKYITHFHMSINILSNLLKFNKVSLLNINTLILFTNIYFLYFI